MLTSAALLPLRNADARGYRSSVVSAWTTSRDGWNADKESGAWHACCNLAAIVEGSPPEAPALTWFSGVEAQPNIYLSSIHTIRNIVGDLAILSNYGHRELELDIADLQYLRSALSYWTFFYLKERDLDAVCPLVRGLKYARLDSTPEFQDGLKFILRQLREGGEFGVLDMPALFGGESQSGKLDIDRELNLPLTVSSLWALLDTVFPQQSIFG